MTSQTYEYETVKAQLNVYKTGHNLKARVIHEKMFLIVWKTDGFPYKTWEPISVFDEHELPHLEVKQYALCLETGETCVPEKWQGYDNFPLKELLAWKEGEAYEPSWMSNGWEKLQHLVTVEDGAAKSHSSSPVISLADLQSESSSPANLELESSSSVMSASLESHPPLSKPLSTPVSHYVSVASLLGGDNLTSATLSHCIGPVENAIEQWFTVPGGRPFERSQFLFQLSPPKDG